MEKINYSKESLYDRLRSQFGLQEFRPLQYQVIRSVFDGGSRVVVMGTGAGKSLCYLLPAMMLPGVTLVVSPLRSLIRDQLQRASRCGLRAVALTGESRPREIAAAEIIFASPERLFTGRACRLLSKVTISHFVIDEAHCVETWGSAFRPYLGLLGELVATFECQRVSLFTASADRERMVGLAKRLELSNPDFLSGGLDRPGIRWHAARTSGPAVAAARLLTLRRGRALVYLATRRSCEEMAAFLEKAGQRAAPYHAGMSDGARERAQDRFVAGRIRVLCATSAFGMGVDIAGIRTVIHTGLPRSLDAYYQEAGRAGRDGHPALAAIFFKNDAVYAGEKGVLEALFKRIRSDLPTGELEEGIFLARLEALAEGCVPVTSLYAFLLSRGVYRRLPGERSVRIRPSGILRYDLKMALLKNLRTASRTRRQVLDYLGGEGCRRNALLATYGQAVERCSGCSICGSEFTSQIEDATAFAERIAALGRRVRALPLHQGLETIRKANLGRGERALAEYAAFRIC